MAQESWKQQQETCQQPDGQIRCAKNCGFFGSPATLNMCSKCYRDHVLQQTKEAAKVSAAAAAMKAAHQAAAAHRSDLMDVDTDSSTKERGSVDTDFMSGVHALAGMSSEDKATSLPAQKPSPLPSISTLPTESSSAAASSSPASAEADSLAVAAAPSPAPVGPNRCAACKKKVGLTGFKCRCNNVFCSTHRYSDKHHCTFDYKAAARIAIAKANPVVRGSKIEKI